ncbi:MAG: HAMP domain-containing sensor histidine kinase [Gemmatimonadaceae bacterium]
MMGGEAGAAPTAEITENCPLAATLARRMREDSIDLTRRWLDRIVARVQGDPNRIFPTDQLLDHVPLLIHGIAAFIENPDSIVITDAPVIAKARELGELRYNQKFDEYEVLKEYELFGGILFAFMGRIVDDIEEPCSRSELLNCAHRLYLAVALIQQATLTRYLTLVRERLHERENRLRGFNRTLSHELKNRLGAITGAAAVLELPSLSADEKERLTAVIGRNVLGMQAVLDNLMELSQLDADVRQQRHITLPRAAAEVARQLRDNAQARNVEVRISSSLPEVEVNAAAVELCLTNLVANAIKYSDMSKPERWVEVGARRTVDAGGVSGADSESAVVVEVRDNGLGVPEAKRARLFERFFRAHDDARTGADGTGLGLSIVRDTAQSLGGTAWAEFPEEGSVFAFTLPARRARDAIALEAARDATGSDS